MIDVFPFAGYPVAVFGLGRSGLTAAKSLAGSEAEVAAIVDAALERFAADTVARPDLALSGDFIVGFPGETDSEFEETLKLVDAVGYAQAFSFKYSPRPGTPAASMEGQVAKEVMDDRLQRLQAALNRDQWAFNRATEGRTCEVLVERKGKHPGQWLGKTPWLQSAWFEGDVGIGDLVQVELVEAGPNSLAGMLRETVAA